MYVYKCKMIDELMLRRLITILSHTKLRRYLKINK